MNEKEAREIIETANAADCQLSRFERDREMKAMGYLQGLKKAKPLLDELNRLTDILGEEDQGIVFNVLRAWEEEK